MNQLIDLNNYNSHKDGLTSVSDFYQFDFIFNKSKRLAAAIFMVANLIDEDEELKTKIKTISLEFISIATGLKDSDLLKKTVLVRGLERKSLELISFLDIASVSGFISEMNMSILKTEFMSFLSDLARLSQDFENSNLSVKNILSTDGGESVGEKAPNLEDESLGLRRFQDLNKNSVKNGNGQKRKDLRKNMILDFIKGHNNVSIKDITPNIVGCSEKTIQRELMDLIDAGKIRKIGERRWSRYTTI